MVRFRYQSLVLSITIRTILFNINTSQVSQLAYLAFCVLCHPFNVHIKHDGLKLLYFR